jgi:hypothetical protein
LFVDVIAPRFVDMLLRLARAGFANVKEAIIVMKESRPLRSMSAIGTGLVRSELEELKQRLHIGGEPVQGIARILHAKGFVVLDAVQCNICEEAVELVRCTNSCPLVPCELWQSVGMVLGTQWWWASTTS